MRAALFLLAVLSAAPGFAQTRGAPASGARYGEQHAMTCTWLSNFENSRLLECDGPAGKSLLDGDGAAIDCGPGQCALLDTEARAAAHWTQREPVDGLFTVRLFGRVSLDRHLKRYLGDATRTVRVDRVLSVRLKR